MANTPSTITVLSLGESESWNVFVRRIRETEGELLVVLGPEQMASLRNGDLQADVLSEFRALSGRLRLACKDSELVSSARLRGIRVLDKPEQLKRFLGDEDRYAEALRIMAPQVWKLQLKSQLQRMGLLSVPKLRIALLVMLSGGLFFFVVFRLLPSAEIRVWPRQETVSQTTNIFLVQTGASIDTTHVRTMILHPISVTITRALTYDQITKEFHGTPSEMAVTVVNRSGESYSLRSGSRIANQAGMVFRLREGVIVEPGEEVTVMARAEDKDLFGKILGERGNVPAGVKWDFIGLPVEDRKAIYGENRTPATGGVTSTRTVLTKQDLENARLKLQQDLLMVAKKAADEEQELWNAAHPEQQMEILRPQYSNLSIVQYKDFVFPDNLIGEPVTSIPVEGSIAYTVFAYDAKQILDLLSDELLSHVREGKEILPDSLTLDHLEVRVIGFADDFTWIKLTADLLGTDRYVLDPLTPTGALFAKKVRENIVGKTKADAQRVLRNMPEVESVDIHMWPPWTGTLPEIPAHISIAPQ